MKNEIQEANQSLIQAKFNELQGTLSKVGEQRDEYLRLSNQPYSKWQAIFNLEQIKERNKPSLPKKDLPKAPFFLFDIDKVIAENDATTDLIKEQFFSKKNKAQDDTKKKSLTDVKDSVINLKMLLRQPRPNI